METPTKFLLPSPDFGKKANSASKPAPHYLTPSGMTLLPRDKQPPPMYGPKGTTIPARFLAQPKQCKEEPLPQEKHYCEPCEMEFQTADDFRRHRAQHERCPVDGCKYKAHPSVMDKHVTELHATGLFEKIKKISTPEEIAAWREERRKKYPTVANTQARRLAKEQRQRRGERLEENKSRFGRHEDRKRARNVENNKEPQAKMAKRSRNNKNKDKNKPKAISKPATEKQAETPKAAEQVNSTVKVVSTGIRMFEGTSKMTDNTHEKTKNKETENVLVSFVGMYGSDDDDNSDEAPEEEAHVVKEQQTIENKQETEVNAENPVEKTVLDNQKCPASITHDRTFDEKPFKNETETSTAEKRAIEIQERAHQSTEIIVEEKITNDSSDEAPDEAPIERTIAIACPIVTPAASKQHSDNNSNISKPAKVDNNPKKTLQEKRKYGLNYRKIRLRKQNTMLEKLLEPDIRHERNVLLQCVRFVCQNNFFGIGSKSTADNTTAS